MSNRKIEISPSVLGADLMRLGEEIRMVEALGIHWLHLDNMDGHFAPNISFGPDFVRAIRRQTKLFLDTHLMLSEPMKYIEAYARAGADLITVHAEADDNCAEVLEAIHALGVKAGVSINPETPVEALEPLLPLCDLVLVMTVKPGFGGQTLREDCVAKIPKIREMIAETGRDILIEVDGGVKQSNAAQVIEAGADVLVMGTGLFRADDPKAVVKTLSVAKQQMVEITKALSHENTRLLILDEPSAVLTDTEIDDLFVFIRQLNIVIRTTVAMCDGKLRAENLLTIYADLHIIHSCGKRKFQNPLFSVFCK